MAFKSIQQVNEEKYNGKFVLRDDGDTADVIFLYQRHEDIMFADVHYIKSNDYNGFVQCIGRGCPVCGGGKIRLQQRYFIPLINLSACDPATGESKPELQFWDRTTKFEQVMSRDVFHKYPNPSKVVFRITRQGEAGDTKTRYNISAVGSYNKPYDEILAEYNIKFPDAYEKICKDYSADKLRELLSQTEDAVDALPDYAVTPRTAIADGAISPIYNPIPEEPSVDFGGTEPLAEEYEVDSEDPGF